MRKTEETRVLQPLILMTHGGSLSIPFLLQFRQPLNLGHPLAKDTSWRGPKGDWSLKDVRVSGTRRKKFRSSISEDLKFPKGADFSSCC